MLEVDGPPVSSSPGDGWLRLPPGLAEHSGCSSAEESLLTLTGVEEYRGSHDVERNLLAWQSSDQHFKTSGIKFSFLQSEIGNCQKYLATRGSDCVTLLVSVKVS